MIQNVSKEYHIFSNNYIGNKCHSIVYTVHGSFYLLPTMTLSTVEGQGL
jgi:hypothetical protein